MTGCSLSTWQVESRHKSFRVHAMFEGGSYHFKYAVPRGETHEDLLDCLAVASNVRDGPVSSQAYRMS